MKKAVIITGGKQYLVSEGDTLDVELVSGDKKSLSFEPLLIIDGANTTVGTPVLKENKVTATIEEQDVQKDKVTSIRYKSKKRVHTVRGHRQRKTTIKISKIS